MVSIGVFSDSDGDLAAFDAALKLLASKGASRFLFAGGRFEDLDNWVKWKREEVKARSDYSGADFLEDVGNYLMGLEQLDRPPAFGLPHEESCAIEELTLMKDKILRCPEKGSLAYLDRAVPKKTLDLLGDTLCCLVYDRNDLDKDDLLNAAVLVHGKEPEPHVVRIGPRTFLTSGSLKGPKPSVGLLELEDNQIFFSAFTLAGETLLERQAIQAGSKSKMTVR